MFRTVILILAILGPLYVYKRCIHTLQLSILIKLLLLSLCLLAAFKMHISRYFFNSLIPEIPSVASIAFSSLHIVFIITLLLLCITDSIHVLYASVQKIQGHGSFPLLHKYTNKTALIFISISLLFSGYGVYDGVRVPPVEHITITNSHVPEDIKKLRIVQLSDLHISPVFRKNWTKAVVDKVNALNPDLILITGDLVDGKVALRTEDVAPLQELRATYGVYACHGNHEYYHHMQSWDEHFTSLGIQMLNNAHTTLQIGQSTLVLGGVTDSKGASRYGLEPSNVAKAFANSPEGWRLLMAHQPDLAPVSAKHNVAVQLSGHTHGGQLMGLNLIVKRANGGFLSGQYNLGYTQLFVHNGTGLWPGLTLRLGVPSYIALLSFE